MTPDEQARSTKRRRVDATVEKSNGTGHDKNSNNLDGPQISLQSYISNIFYEVFIQDDDDIALQIYEKNWSKHVKEV